MKMMYGCLSTGAPSLFITNTYVLNQESDLRDASCVAKEWAALWRLLKGQAAWKEAAWVKVPELTKRGQIHLHGIVLNVKGRASCRTKPTQRKKWMTGNCSVNCLEHDLARAWYEVTGDSYVVDCQVVRTANGICNYVIKYMDKTFANREAIEERGIKRRWSASRNWPRCEPLRLKGTEVEAWTQIKVIDGRYLNYSDEHDSTYHYTYSLHDLRKQQEEERPYLLESVGGDYLLEVQKLARKKKITQNALKGLGIEYD